ncbi:MAG TPA: flagellar protein FliS [Allosphingosinicella sp.]|jgi:flagellar protein FliS|nr:flagellar protein FliS [Allosphingosinicella sp.]
MYMGRQSFGAARARYQNVDLASRIEAASPHRLVAILLDELTKALDAMAAACRASDFTQRGQRQSRALAILHGLEGSLDFEKGGDVAASLAAIYREARRLVAAAGRDNDEAAITKAREMIDEIASAWNAIG